MKAWSKLNHRSIDQRDMVLPPAWCPRQAAAADFPIEGSGVLRSDPSRRLARKLIDALSSAREMVVAASFLLADKDIERALLEAAQRGVRVYLLLAAETRLESKSPDDSEFDQRALAAHERMLNDLAGWALIRSSPSFHAKVLLVDPKQDGPGFLLTANLTQEALVRNEELAVELTAAESRSVLAHLAWAMWEAAEHELLEPERLAVAAKPLSLVAKPSAGGAVVATLKAPGTLCAAALQLVASAERELIVASFGWDADHAVLGALCEKARAGVLVTVLARIRPASMPALLALCNSGARVFGFRWLHAKAIASDSGAGVVMSSNLQRQGLDAGFELGIMLEGRRAAALRAVLHGWRDEAQYELLSAPRLGDVEGEALVWTENKLRPVTVLAEVAFRAESRVAAHADQLDTDPPLPPRGSELRHPGHQLDLTWEVTAPRLAPKSKPFDPKLGKFSQAEDPAVFREGNQRIVVAVRTPAELPRARAIIEQMGRGSIVVRGE